MPAAREVRSVTAKLVRQHGPQDLGNHRDPLDELVYIVLSAQTALPVARRVFASVKRRFPAWTDARRAGVRGLELAIRGAGLGALKARCLLAAFARIEERFGELSLDGLRELSTRDAEDFLVSLPFVKIKTARCILLYSLGRPVFPADTHCLRISRRLGWSDADTRRVTRADADELQRAIPPRLRLALHVAMVAHGRAVCRAVRPACERCSISSVCAERSRHS
jgi:endonuclease III